MNLLYLNSVCEIWLDKKIKQDLTKLDINYKTHIYTQKSPIKGFMKVLKL